ncbi:helix-turn-helix domain-containing protein [Archangium violaceum]|uniref:helix-turn-helix domain-containing protein n=1 Tax=Archangium violaceum TaxID=83451 RepID=UPI00193C4ED5|nr:helix-turn-helix transcriptional regulator [Archangium violaceum]QRK12314.1 helix-turn-helix domain-containing protein [Archangium violaceum]
MDVALKKYLGKSARAARVHKGFTQAEVAQRAELAVAVYGRIERGEMMPSLPTVQRLCRVLEVDANTLLGFSSPTPPAWFTSPPPKERPAVHEFLRTARRMKPRQLRALRSVAQAMLTTNSSTSRQLTLPTQDARC